jgi:predicted Rossmann fold nucleotide-binding protein DprA/Smf involved in DNA uptake
MIVAITGHRPEDSLGEEDVRVKTRAKIKYTKGVDTVICGMAAGVDLWAADEALNAGKEVWAAVPWLGHTPRKGDEDLYQTIIDMSSKVVYVTEVKDYPGPWVYQKRNEWMVDNADVVMAYWSGIEAGGTFNCINYARKQGKKIANVYHDAPF